MATHPDPPAADLLPHTPNSPASPSPHLQNGPLLLPKAFFPLLQQGKNRQPKDKCRKGMHSK